MIKINNKLNKNKILDKNKKVNQSAEVESKESFKINSYKSSIGLGLFFFT